MGGFPQSPFFVPPSSLPVKEISAQIYITMSVYYLHFMDSTVSFGSKSFHTRLWRDSVLTVFPQMCASHTPDLLSALASDYRLTS